MRKGTISVHRKCMCKDPEVKEIMAVALRWRERIEWGKGHLQHIKHFCLYFKSKCSEMIWFAIWKYHVGCGVEKWLKKGRLDLYKWVGSFKMFQKEIIINWARTTGLKNKMADRLIMYSGGQSNRPWWLIHHCQM